LDESIVTSVEAARAAGPDTTAWDYPDPFWIEMTVESGEIDRLGHVNHSVYLQWCEECGWQHAESVAAGWKVWQALDRAMVVVEVRLSYRGTALRGDVLRVANWVIHNNGRLRATRHFQIVRPRDAETLLRGEIDYVCIQTTTGRPRRFPPEFIDAYAVLPSVAAALVS
jgi:acyl-CoA thioester hydrolase